MQTKGTPTSCNLYGCFSQAYLRKTIVWSYSWKRLRRGVGAVCVLLTIISLPVSGCTSRSSEPSKANQPPVIHSIVLGPTPFDRQTDLIAQVNTQDLDSDIVQVRYHWYLNDQVIEGEKSPTLSASLLKRGDRVHLEAVPFDGKVSGSSRTSEVITVGNTPPLIAQVGIGVNSDERGDRLQALVDASDHDQDTPQFLYRWIKNGRVVKEGEEDFLELTEVRPHDLVVVEVRPRDTQAAGKMSRSDPYTVGNSAPKIVSSPPMSINHNRYEYVVKAVDPDSDSVHFQLEVAPPGMAIDQTTGNILWDTGYVKPGVHRVKIVATDEQGGFSFQEFELTIATAETPKPES
ncbi:conserved hypothetical protein [Candidatus Nitrospira nitrificans]|uniref:Cadherin domain-containing protein n=1 Tax=Candidatus Nitrospira nitrificans TaxID=1742973 RepID=A0A0S4LHY0_9BACT|nr:conserved hypothetical protein [Candidatus Nitrospira nitrificans]